jgi:hypothetical protein
MAGALDHAKYVNTVARETLEELAYLISCDGNHENKGQAAGSFQDDDSVPELLFFISETMNHIGALVSIGNFAMQHLKHHPELRRD